MCVCKQVYECVMVPVLRSEGNFQESILLVLVLGIEFIPGLLGKCFCLSYLPGPFI